MFKIILFMAVAAAGHQDPTDKAPKNEMKPPVIEATARKENDSKLKNEMKSTSILHLTVLAREEKAAQD